MACFVCNLLLGIFFCNRYKWQHAVWRDKVTSCRIATTFRELTPEFLPGGGRAELGQKIIDIALTYTGTAVGCVDPSSSACSDKNEITNSTSRAKQASCENVHLKHYSADPQITRTREESEGVS